MIVIVSMVIGSLLGELAHIEDGLDKLGTWAQKRFAKGDTGFAAGFVNATLLFCVGAMAVVGSLEAGLTGKSDTLLAKAVLDGVSALIFASSLGIGVAFSAIPLTLYQGGIALLDGTGYFCSDRLTGMESCFDKIQYCPYADKKQWDFSRYTPDCVVIALGQNDANPEPERIKTPEYRRMWKDEYIKFLRTLMEKYPAANFVLILTILGHDHTWDDALEEITREVNSGRVSHFMFRRTGCGTNGHPRATEQEEMAEELYRYINGNILKNV